MHKYIGHDVPEFRYKLERRRRGRFRRLQPNEVRRDATVEIQRSSLTLASNASTPLAPEKRRNAEQTARVCSLIELPNAPISMYRKYVHLAKVGAYSASISALRRILDAAIKGRRIVLAAGRRQCNITEAVNKRSL